MIWLDVRQAGLGNTGSADDARDATGGDGHVGLGILFIAEWTDEVTAGRIDRRTFIGRLAALGLGAPAIGTLAAGVPTRAAAAPGGDPTTILIATSETPPGLDMEYNGSRSSHEGIAQTIDTLVWYDKKLGADGLLYSDFSKLTGALAESWDADADGRGVTFHLRKGVMSHWGNELTADDVFYSWNRAFQLKSNRMSTFVRMRMKDPSAIKIIDKYTVRFEYEAPRSIGVVMHSSIYVGINDSVACKANATASDPWAKEWIGKNGGGFGSYYVDTWQPGQQVIFRAHEGYWRGAPTIKRVIVRAVPNSANRLALIQTGAVDIAQWLLPNEVLQAAKNPDVKVSNFRSNFHVIYCMNTTKPPFDNPKVRQAFKWAYPYDAVLKTVFMGLAEPCKSLVPSVFPDSNETYYPFTTDPEKAKALLAEAGFPDGLKVNLTYNTEISWDEQLAILTQTSLKKAGIELTLNKLPGGQFFDQEWGRQLTTYFFEDQPNVPAAEYALWAFANSAARGNHTAYSNKEIDALTDGALSEPDPVKRQQMNYKAQQILCADGALVFIARPPLSLAMNPAIKGARWYPAEHIRWDEHDEERKVGQDFRFCSGCLGSRLLLVYVLRRCLALLPQLLAISVVTFVLARMLPGDPVSLILGPMATQESLNTLRSEMHLDQPYYIQYYYYLRSLLHGDLGRSWSTSDSVLDDLLARVPATLELITYSLVLALVVGISIGIATSFRQGGWVDRVTRLYGLLAGALPDFWLGLLLIFFFYYKLRIFPAPLGRLDPYLTPPTFITGMYTIDSILTGNWECLVSAVTHLALPVLTLAFASAGSIMRMTRSTMMGILDGDFIRHGRLSGLPERTLVRYAVRNSLPPVVTLIAIIYGFLLGGAVLIENVFGWGGLGQYAVQALSASDYAAIQGFVLVAATFTLILYLVVDLLYFAIDPRLSY